MRITYPQPILIPVGTQAHAVDEPTVIIFLMKVKRTAPDPDGLLYWLWKDFSHLLALIITKLFNLSIEPQCFPLMWRLGTVNPLSLTNIINRLLDRQGYFLNRRLRQMCGRTGQISI